MTIIRDARPSSSLPARVTIAGRFFEVKVIDGPLLITIDGFSRERSYVVDHDRRVFRLSSRVPSADRRFVLARALSALNTEVEKPDTDPPAGGGLPNYSVAGHRDDTLIAAIAAVDEDTPGRGWCRFLGIHNADHKAAYIDAATAEVLRRLGQCRAA